MLVQVSFLSRVKPWNSIDNFKRKYCINRVLRLEIGAGLAHSEQTKY